MNIIKIKKPIWYNRSVGLSVEKLRGGDVEVQILYKDEDGHKVFPSRYKANSEKILSSPRYSTMTIKNNVLKIVPISDLEVLCVKK